MRPSVSATPLPRRGKLEFRENTNFPTLDFPSDHGLVALALAPVASTSPLPWRGGGLAHVWLRLARLART
eukprot:15472775-Alexandrium_andersonii.AAC.1